MAHLFVSPHPDDVALSCGGLISKLRSAGEEIAIVTVYSGAGNTRRLTPYQREALGFGTLATRGRDDRDADALEVAAAEQVMSERRKEDIAYASLQRVSIAFLNLPDAVFRGYEGDEQLFGPLRGADPCPLDVLRRHVASIRPRDVYFPLAIGGHVDHRQVRDVAFALLSESHGSTSSPRSIDRQLFYEDVPYSFRLTFQGLDDLPPGELSGLPADVALSPEYADIGDVIDRKIEAIRTYGSQLDRLFGGAEQMAATIREEGARIGSMVGLRAAERYWRPHT